MSSPSPQGRLASRTAIITGGSMGLGAGIVTKFLAEGANVLIFDIKPPVHQKDLPQDRVAFYEGDVTREEDWIQALKVVVERWGSVDICVNNAGVVHCAGPSIEVPKEEYDRIMTTNITPLYHSAKVLQPHMIQQGKGGSFVNISSISAPRPRPNLVWYAGSKGAVSSITRGLAAEFAPHAIRCNTILPVVAETGMVSSVLGGTDSEEGRKKLLTQIPLGRICMPEDVGNAACFLASDESSFITGVEVPVDGGRSLM